MKKKLFISIIASLIYCNLFGQTNIVGSIIHQTYQREFTVHLPTGFNITTQRSLVINLHGGSGNMNNAQGFSLMNPVADQNNFVVVYPQGYGIASPGFSWADGRNTSADQAGIDDIGFINNLLDYLIATYNINTNRIYICGFSNGGFMVQRIACQLSDRFAAMASLGSSMDTSLFQNCNPSKPIPFAFFNGTSDPAMPYGGGPMQNPQVTPVVPVESTIDFWVNQNNCQTSNAVINLSDTFTTDNSTAELYTYTNCDCNSDIKFYKLINGGHTWPGVYIASQASVLGNTNRDINASFELWNFFNSHNLCSSLGIDEQIIESRMETYPNPVKTELNIDIPQDEKTEILITNLLGQNLIKVRNQNKIDVSYLQNGIYILTVTKNQKAFIQKFVKE
jgi:polyhydroxybutyrate depolymerase